MLRDVYAITLWPEWAWAICYLDKRIENRRWFPFTRHINTRICIHAGANIGGKPGYVNAEDGFDDVAYMAEGAGWYVRTSPGMVHKKEVYYASFTKDEETVDISTLTVPRKSIVAVATLTGAHKPVISNFRKMPPWAVSGQYHWYLKDVDVLDEPIECRGAQLFWEVKKKHVEEIKRQLGDGVFYAFI